MIPGSQEWIIIFLAIILLFGASKIPELARSLGKATGEFKKAKEETNKEIQELTSTKETTEDPSSKIRKMASELGIDPTGKKDSEILDEIKKKTLQN